MHGGVTDMHTSKSRRLTRSRSQMGWGVVKLEAGKIRSGESIVNLLYPYVTTVFIHTVRILHLSGGGSKVLAGAVGARELHFFSVCSKIRDGGVGFC